MNARDRILNAIAQNQPTLLPLPEVDIDIVIRYDDVCQQFKNVLESIGAQVHFVRSIDDVKKDLEAERKKGSFIINTIEALGVIDEDEAVLPADKLEQLNRGYFKGSVGIAENGAIWLYESQMLNRLLPFICKHLVLVIERKDVVPTLHQAYAQIDIAKFGYGVLIAGPSKTADIEQSLVIGAHGPKSATVFVVDESA